MIRYCIDCHKEISKNCTRCIICSNKSRINPNKTMIIKCCMCNKDIKKLKSSLKFSKYHTCSIGCRNLLIKKLNTKYKESNKCIDCGKEICRKRKVKRCVQCNNKRNIKRKILNCIVCNKKFEVMESKSKIRKFCSRKCSAQVKNRTKRFKKKISSSLIKFYQNRDEKRIKYDKYRVSGNKNPNWRGGVSNDPYSFDFNELLKDQIRERDNFMCQKCYITEEEHLIVYGFCLHVHHIDYNKKNSVRENLITLCVECNSRVNFNRKYWMEYFKKKIGELYVNMVN